MRRERVDDERSVGTECDDEKLGEEAELVMKVVKTIRSKVKRGGLEGGEP